MIQSLRASLATIKVSIREENYFGIVSLVGNYLVRLAQLLLLLMIWRALFSQGADMEGMTLHQMLSYTLLSGALAPLLDVRTPASSWLHQGTIISLYGRPQGLFTQLTVLTAGRWVMPLMLFGLPVLLIGGLSGALMPPHSLWFFPSLALAVGQGFAVDYLFTCLIIRARNLSWPIHGLRGALTALLTGAVIPFAALPWGLDRILPYTPLGTLAGAPLALYCGLESPFPLVFVQLIWNLTLWPLALLLFNKSRERMVSYGG